MAEKRMFSRNEIDSDEFMGLPTSAQALYFHLGLNADDDGFVAKPRTIARSIGASENDLSLLAEKGYIIEFGEKKIVVITAWCVHNKVRSDSYKRTKYTEEFSKLGKGADDLYFLSQNDCNEPVTESAQVCNEPVTESVQVCNEHVTQDRRGKERIGEISLGESEKRARTHAEKETAVPGNAGFTSEKSAEGAENADGNGFISQNAEKAKKVPSEKSAYGERANVLLSAREYDDLRERFGDFNARIDRLSHYIASTGKNYASHYETILKWAKEDEEKEKSEAKKPEEQGSFDTDDFFNAALERTRRKMMEASYGKSESSGEAFG